MAENSTSETPIRRQQYAPERLTEFAREHVTYEISAAANDAVMSQSSPALLSRWASSAVLVSGLVHLRLLDEFIGSRERLTIPVETKAGPRLDELDSVLAVDYLASWATHAARPLDGSVRQAINAQVAHLAMSRETGRVWDLGHLTVKVLRALEDFFHRLASEQSVYIGCFESARVVVDRFLTWADENDMSIPIEDGPTIDDEAAGFGSRHTLTTSDALLVDLFSYPVPRMRGS